MMETPMDPWTDRLSEYIDGELDATSVAALEQHLRDCAACSDIVSDLRLIASDAAALEPVAPPHDLWPAIAAGLGARTTPASDSSDVISLDAHRATSRSGGRSDGRSVTPITRRSVTMSLPQLAAAAVVLLALGGTAVWKLQPTAPASTVASNNATQRGSLRNVASQPGAAVQTTGYDAAIHQLEEVAAANEARLDPKTKKVIAQSMVTIDRAIAEARAALAADPANAYLHRHLDRTMKQKLELLRQAAKIDRGGA